MADHPEGDVQALAEQFVASLDESCLRPALRSLAPTILKGASRSTLRVSLRPGRPRFASRDTLGRREGRTLNQEIMGLAINLDGEFRALGTLTAAECRTKGQIRRQKAQEIAAHGDAWINLADTLDTRRRKTVSGLDAQLVIDILGDALNDE